MNNKAIYSNQKAVFSAPIFHQPWWLDIVCQKGRWDICTATDKENNIIGTLPYYLTSIFGCKIIRTPPFTPYLGVWLDYSQCSERNVSRYSFENEVIGALVEQLPKVASYNQIHPPQLQNWLPFYWKGYTQTTRYTYVLENLNPEKVFEKMKSEVRTRIRKAHQLFKIEEHNILGDFFQFYENTMKRQGLSLRRNKRILEALHKEIQAREVGKIYNILDSNGKKVAALYMIWDNNTAYYWLPCLDKRLGHQGAVQLLLWHAIQTALHMGKSFNFEGSMLPHIEPVFRAFGAERRPVFQIRKFGNRLLKAMWVLLKG